MFLCVSLDRFWDKQQKTGSVVLRYWWRQIILALHFFDLINMETLDLIHRWQFESLLIDSPQQMSAQYPGRIYKWIAAVVLCLCFIVFKLFQVFFSFFVVFFVLFHTFGVHIHEEYMLLFSCCNLLAKLRLDHWFWYKEKKEAKNRDANWKFWFLNYNLTDLHFFENKFISIIIWSWLSSLTLMILQSLTSVPDVLCQNASLLNQRKQQNSF